LAAKPGSDTLAAGKCTDLDQEINRMSVILYTKPGCPYCAKARDYYNGKGISFEDRNAQDNLDYRKEMFAFSDGDPTVPVIVENGRLKQIGWEGRG
jgi:glutaredoxin